LTQTAISTAETEAATSRRAFRPAGIPGDGCRRKTPSA